MVLDLAREHLFNLWCLKRPDSIFTLQCICPQNAVRHTKTQTDTSILNTRSGSFLQTALQQNCSGVFLPSQFRAGTRYMIWRQIITLIRPRWLIIKYCEASAVVFTSREGHRGKLLCSRLCKEMWPSGLYGDSWLRFSLEPWHRYETCWVIWAGWRWKSLLIHRNHPLNIRCGVLSQHI